MSKNVQCIVVDQDSDYYDAVKLGAESSFLAYQEMTPEWQDWLGGSFTKTVRRAKSSLFDKIVSAAEKGELTSQYKLLTSSKARVIAFSPLTYDDFPKLLKKCQVSGLELSGKPEDVDDTVKSIVQTNKKWGYETFLVNSSLGMSVGKECAQVAHALWMVEKSAVLTNSLQSVPFVKFYHVSQPVFEQYKKIASYVVVDNGLTEVEPGSSTVLVIDKSSNF